MSYMNVVIYAEYRNSYSEIIGVVQESMYDVLYPQIEQWAKDNGYDRITESVVEGDQGYDMAIEELQRIKKLQEMCYDSTLFKKVC